jgi:hypothetical protein
VFSNPVIRQMAGFLETIGIPLVPASSLLPANFPGLDIQCGSVLVDETRVIHVGDILHEAGHIALTAPEFRSALRLSPTGGEEMATMAWSYAAAQHLGLGAELVFYPESYSNFGNGLIEIFADGRYIGIPLLQLFGMSFDAKKGAEKNVEPFPHMVRWLRG